MLQYNSMDRKKIGNAVVYIAQRIPLLSKTKLLKLLYLMEEYSVKEFQTPFLGIPYEVWQAGPVAKDIFIDLSETPTILNGFVKKVVKNNNTYIEPIAEFSDNEFSDNDIIVMDNVISIYGKETAKQLVDITHKKNSLWYNIAQKNNLIELFKQGKINNSDYQIDFSEQLSERDKIFYREQMDFLLIARTYGK